MYPEGDDDWLVLHNDVYARFRDDMEDIVPGTALPAFQQTPYTLEPYLEGAYVIRYGGKYYLMHAAWECVSTNPDGSTRHAYDPPGPAHVKEQYDLVMAVSDRFEGPYSHRGCWGRSQQRVRRRVRPAVGDVLPEPCLRLLPGLSAVQPTPLPED